jgi:uncharacterized membrane protein
VGAATVNVDPDFCALEPGGEALRAWIAYLWYRLTSGLWVVPALMIAAAIVLALVSLTLDYLFRVRWLSQFQSVFAVGPEGARLVLSTIAGSMITVASLVFSMTLVTLTLASSQLGPRLIARFMADGVNQVVLGTFIATFLYALLVLQTVTEGESEVFVPHISMTGALALTLISLGWLVYFIHHVADSIQADTVIAKVYDDLIQALDHLYPRLAGQEPASWATKPIPTDLLAQAPASIPAHRGGYVQAIDTHALLSLAREHDLVIRIERRPGHFVIAQRPLMQAWPEARVTEQVIEAAAHNTVVGPKRTPTQDVEFSIGELVEIGVRALSPGINDPRTAMTCIDRLAAAMAHLMRSGERSPLIHDQDGTLRLITRPTTIEDAVDVAFNQLRQAANGHVAVLLRLIEALTALAEIAATDRERAALARHGDMLRRACRRSIAEDDDQGDAQRRLRALDAALAGEPGSEVADPSPRP